VHRVFTDRMNPSEEVQALAQVAERLRGRFPDAPADTIDQLVKQVHHEFDGHPIRDFIPVLVEREAVDHLRAHPRSRVATSA
jgi:hypothetical protein